MFKINDALERVKSEGSSPNLYISVMSVLLCRRTVISAISPGGYVRSSGTGSVSTVIGAFVRQYGCWCVRASVQLSVRSGVISVVGGLWPRITQFPP